VTLFIFDKRTISSWFKGTESVVLGAYSACSDMERAGSKEEWCCQNS
jgi:hypothetical protein